MNLRGYLINDKPGPPGQLAQDEEQERSFLKESSTVLASCFPNPGRSGCPDSSVLRLIAANKLRLRDAAPWMDHLGSCSECYRDFSQYKEAARHRRLVRFVYSTAASVLLAIALFLVFWKSHRKEVAHHKGNHPGITPLRPNVNGATEYATFVLDARDAAQVRGENGAGGKVRKLPRQRLHVLAHLPLGTEIGEYTVLMKREGKPVWSGSTIAQVRDQQVVAEFDADFTRYPPGRYALDFLSKDGMRLRQNINVEEPPVERK